MALTDELRTALLLLVHGEVTSDVVKAVNIIAKPVVEKAAAPEFLAKRAAPAVKTEKELAIERYEAQARAASDPALARGYNTLISRLRTVGDAR